MRPTPWPWSLDNSATSGSDNGYAVSKWSTAASPGTNEWCLLVGSGGVTGDTPSFDVEIGTNKFKIIDPQEISLDDWHHVVGVRQGQTISLYVDGVLVDTDSTLPSGGEVNNVGSELRIAVNQPAAPLFYTDAVFDDVQIYGFALDDGGVSVGQTAGRNIAFLYANPGTVVSLLVDGFESGDTSAWSSTVP